MTTRCQALQEAENMRHPHSGDLVEQLRHRACPPEGEYLEHDHGHSDCYLEREAADEIETLRELADALDERCTKLRELIATWVNATDRWNKAMWTKDLTTEQRSLIEKELTSSINLLIVAAAPQPLRAVGR